MYMYLKRNHVIVFVFFFLETKMVLGNLTHVQKVRLLYKSCLKLHRGLPLHLKAIGDTYVRDEFRRHVKADEQQVQLFMEAWAVSLDRNIFTWKVFLNHAENLYIISIKCWFFCPHFFSN